jgi:Helix-turn-helix domain
MTADTSDPKALRALAHPVRWKLIDVIAGEGTATVTRCAEVLGESTATCSYHLGILAKYGYISRVPAGPGRDKPWQLASPDLNLSPPGRGAEADAASRAAAAAFLNHAMADLKESLVGPGARPGQDRAINKIMAVTRWLTAAEAQDMADELGAILDRYPGREDPAQRPPDACPTRILAAITPALARRPAQRG